MSFSQYLSPYVLLSVISLSSTTFFCIRFKFIAAVTVLAGGMMLLGFVSEAGGESLSASKQKESMSNLSTKQEEVMMKIYI